MTSASVRSRWPGAIVQPRAASRGRTSPIARMMVERSTPIPAGQHVVRGTVAEAHQCGQQPVDEDQFVPGPGAHGATTRARGECRLVTFVPQRTDLSDAFSDHVGRQPGDALAADNCCTSSGCCGMPGTPP